MGARPPLTVKILYVALKESLPGAHGGAVHVLEVARQLTRRGHELTAIVQSRSGQAPTETTEGFRVIRLPVRSNFLLFQSEPRLCYCIEQLKPDVVMERYYNFAGGGIFAAQKAGRPALLEVNAPMIDPPGTTKHRADRLMLGWMSRRALAQANAAARIVTPLAATIPASVPLEKIHEIPWGANVELFNRARLDPTHLEALRLKLNPNNKRVVVFLGSFRPWHGVRELVQVASDIARTRNDVLFWMVGSGDLLEELRGQVARESLSDKIVLTGAVPYDDVPYYLALAAVGVAPFNTGVHPPLRLGFYWSPLKVHEYMAMALPVVTIDVPGLNEIARQNQEGLLYGENDWTGLRANILRLVDDPALARRLGDAGRERVVEKFSWQKHAELLEEVLSECVKRSSS